MNRDEILREAAVIIGHDTCAWKDYGNYMRKQEAEMRILADGKEEMKMTTLGSLFDGIGGWPLAATKHGIEPVWAAEIEPLPIEVTKKHFPTMKQLGDITGINGAEIEPVDIICMGSPCQDWSIAGKREGLAGARSGLFMDAVRIVREMRELTNGKYPRFVVWENVPGAFSSNKGSDFRAVLEEITESQVPMPKSGRWAKAGMVRSNSCEVAWRTLDAQYWGVPQRRKRIFLVSDFRGGCAAEILFKPEGVSGYPTAGGVTGQSITGSNTSGTRTTVYESHPSDSRVTGPLDVSPTVTVRWRKGAPDTPLVCEPVIYTFSHACDVYCAEAHCKVRRMTPIECERLQGLSDGYTLIDDKRCSDSARYKALGNGMAQPCADFVIQRIAEVAQL